MHGIPDDEMPLQQREAAEYDQENKPPNPGSDAAIDAGCLCPVLDNAHGKGYMCIPGVFVYTESCPVHNVDRRKLG